MFLAHGGLFGAWVSLLSSGQICTDAANPPVVAANPALPLGDGAILGWKNDWQPLCAGKDGHGSVECASTTTTTHTTTTHTTTSTTLTTRTSSTETSSTTSSTISKTSTSSTTLYLPFDCQDGYTRWRQEWPTEKQLWCCRMVGFACGPSAQSSTETYDTQTATASPGIASASSTTSQITASFRTSTLARTSTVTTMPMSTTVEAVKSISVPSASAGFSVPAAGHRGGTQVGEQKLSCIDALARLRQRCSATLPSPLGPETTPSNSAERMLSSLARAAASCPFTVSDDVRWPFWVDVTGLRFSSTDINHLLQCASPRCRGVAALILMLAGLLLVGLGRHRIFTLARMSFAVAAAIGAGAAIHGVIGNGTPLELDVLLTVSVAAFTALLAYVGFEGCRLLYGVSIGWFIARSLAKECLASAIPGPGLQMLSLYAVFIFLGVIVCSMWPKPFLVLFAPLIGSFVAVCGALALEPLVVTTLGHGNSDQQHLVSDENKFILTAVATVLGPGAWQIASAIPSVGALLAVMLQRVSGQRTVSVAFLAAGIICPVAALSTSLGQRLLLSSSNGCLSLQRSPDWPRQVLSCIAWATIACGAAWRELGTLQPADWEISLPWQQLFGLARHSRPAKPQSEQLLRSERHEFGNG